jgi:hypothetical protein
MAASQEGDQHDAGSPGLGELVKFSADAQLAELRCLDGGAAQGIRLRPAAAATSGSATAVSHTGAQVNLRDYKLIQHVTEPSGHLTAGHAEGDFSVMPLLPKGDGSLIDDIQPVSKIDDLVLVEDASQVSTVTRRPLAALFARVACLSVPAPFAYVVYHPFSMCLVLFLLLCLSALLDNMSALHSSVARGSSFSSMDSYRHLRAAAISLRSRISVVFTHPADLRAEDV